MVAYQPLITSNYGEDSMTEKEFINEMAEHIIRDESSLFLGAGSSCSVGFPSWGKLLEECAHKLNIKITKDMDINMQIEILTEQMRLAASELRFEDAAKLRDKIKSLDSKR